MRVPYSCFFRFIGNRQSRKAITPELKHDAGFNDSESSDMTKILNKPVFNGQRSFNSTRWYGNVTYSVNEHFVGLDKDFKSQNLVLLNKLSGIHCFIILLKSWQNRCTSHHLENVTRSAKAFPLPSIVLGTKDDHTWVPHTHWGSVWLGSTNSVLWCRSDGGVPHHRARLCSSSPSQPQNPS